MALSSKERQKRHRTRRIEKGVCVQCGAHKPWKNGQMCRDCLDKHNAWYKTSDYRDRNTAKRAGEKKSVIEHYGGRCACCREDEHCFLAVDHIEGNGNSHRKKINKWGSGFYKWLINNQFPDGFQLLCHNCNMGKHMNNGICPHKSCIST